MAQDSSPRRIAIAIDGPAGAGKSTVARLVAGRFGYVYIDTGAMYRAVALAALRAGVEPGMTGELEKLVSELDIRLEPGDVVQRVRLNGEDVTDEIRSRAVTSVVPAYAAVPAVRARLVELQRAMAREGGVVMDGRDIGTHVLPDAELKVFLTASVQERARRRYEESGRAQGMTLEMLEEEIAERDRQDASREISPLVKAEDAIVLDTTTLTAEEAAERIAALAGRSIAEAGRS
ncbi:MAG: (d)CMP kinase [Thermobacillus sp.]|uniref:(d)CMP kinase n=1 Tax=Thermobacillus sp. TaxID=2108467 RepID=UPI0005A46F2B|nr:MULTISPECIES: (d)CMP kinase [Thermobacillus]REK59177.1 MAG: (d)CMP kinase [Thermobacillus sp.]